MSLMAGRLSFICPDCGRRHEGSPSLSFASPHYWDADAAQLMPQTELTSDLCMIEGRDHFIRCILEIPISEAEEPFVWGVWVSQSETNFNTYRERFDDTPERITFGYLSNRLWGYPDTLNLKTRVHWVSSGQRPWVEPEASDHPLYNDYVHGITWDRAIELVMPAFHN